MPAYVKTPRLSMFSDSKLSPGRLRSPNLIQKRTPEIAQRLHQKMRLDSPPVSVIPTTVPASVPLDIKPVIQCDKSRRGDILVHHVRSWMQPGSAPSSADILRLFECIERLVVMMEYDFPKLLWPLLIYAETYVRRTSLVDGVGLFPLLVVAASLSMKMWEDYGPDLELTAHVCGISKKEISAMERKLLEKLNFSLLLQMSDLEEFQSVPAISFESVDPIGRSSTPACS